MTYVHWRDGGQLALENLFFRVQLRESRKIAQRTLVVLTTSGLSGSGNARQTFCERKASEVGVQHNVNMMSR